ncbi:MAG: hypothetical protein ACI4VG_03200 [Lachnospiraceae bacterium]
MNSWIPKALKISMGLFHLNAGGEGNWGCIYVSEKCLELLDCGMPDFLEKLQQLPILSLGDIPEKTIGMMLEKMKRTRESGAFVSVRELENGELQYIRGTLAVSMSADGRLRVYGQIVDVSEMISGK